VLDNFGQDSSRLDDRDSITHLIKGDGLAIVKPALTSVAGVVSNGKEAYPNNANCTWMIEVPGALNVTLAFTHFDVENDHDYVLVYDGLSIDTTLLARLTGRQLSGNSLPKPITSSSGAMLIVLLADGGTNSTGFEATYRADNAPADAKPVAEEGSNMCTPAKAPPIALSTACRLCVLATVAGVGGESFVEDNLHIVPVSSMKKIPPMLCMPLLAERLAAAQMVRVERALTDNSLFGLVSSGSLAEPSLSFSDLFLPEPGDKNILGQAVFVGLDTGYRIYPCNPVYHRRIWAISSSIDHEQWHRCEGLLWLDLHKSQARSQLAYDTKASLPLVLYDDLHQCVVVLLSTPPMSGNTLRFGPGTAPETVACWLMRFFGPQAAAVGDFTLPQIIFLPGELPPVRLIADLVVRTGHDVKLIGSESTLIVGKQQLRVQTGATLDLLGVTIAESATASALVIAGRISMKNCTIRDCVAQANSLSGYGLESRGGGMYVKSGGNAAVSDCRLVGNAARNGNLASEGGAIYAGFNSSVKLVGSVLSLNVVSTSTSSKPAESMLEIQACGGAVMLVMASATLEDTLLLSNRAIGNACAITDPVGRHINQVEGVGKALGGAICARGPGSTLNILRSKITDNSALSEVADAEGGALYLFNGVSSDIALSEFTANRARSLGSLKLKLLRDLDGKSLGAVSLGAVGNGGALCIGWAHRINIHGCRVERNAAEAPGDSGLARGGGLYANCFGFLCQLNITNTTVVGNGARVGGALSQAYGGGLYIREHPAVKVIWSRINENAADGGKAGTISTGGGLWMATSSVATIDDTELVGNVAKNGTTFSRGGAMGVSTASEATLGRVVVRDNSAEFGGLVSEGGGFFLAQSSLIVSESYLLKNMALHGAKESRGGLISLLAPSSVRIVACTVSENTATSFASEARCSGGAIYADDGASQVRILASQVANNSVFGLDAISAGGAIYAGKQSQLALSDSGVDGNSVSGGSAQGGAIWSGGESLAMTNVSLLANIARANGTDGAAIAGAIFQQATAADLVGCRLFDNRAMIAYPAIRASGGAVHVSLGARMSLLRCLLRHNAAGGPGRYQTSASTSAALAEQRASSAMHIYSEGDLTLYGCTMSDEIGQQAIQNFRYTMWWWIVAEKGTVELRGSTFDASARFDPCPYSNSGLCDVPTYCPAGDYADCGTAASAAAPGYFFDPCLEANDGKCDSADPSCATTDYVDCHTTPPPDAGPFGKLLNVRSAQVEVVVRSSTVTNLTIQVVGGMLGVVNSTFMPQLNDSAPTTRTVKPNPDCGTKLLGRPLCDPRALCKPRFSGGVECSCVGKGLYFRPGVPADGQRCQQQTSIKLLTQSSRVTVLVKKPTFRAAAVAVVFAAAGEIGFTASFNVSMTRVRPDDGAPQQVRAPNSTEHGWSSIDQQRLSMDGHHVIWEGSPPSADGAVDLNLNAGKFSFSRTFPLSIELNCTAGEPCVEDGDTVHTRVTAMSASDGLVSEVLISTTVESLASCNRSVAAFMQSGSFSENGRPVTDSLVTDFALVFVELHVVDVDGLPIRTSQPKSLVVWGTQEILPTKLAEPSSNRFTAVVEASSRSMPGSYRLQVVLLDAWNETIGGIGNCVLLERTVHVEKPQTLITMWLAVGSLSACAVFVGVVVLWARRMSAELKNILLMVLTEASKTVVAISFELGDLATDLFTTYRVVFEGIVMSTNYRVPFAVFGCLCIVTGMVSITHHIRRACKLRSQLKTDSEMHHGLYLTDEKREEDAILHRLKWELERASRDQVGLAINVLCLSLEHIPMVRRYGPTVGKHPGCE
jgi:hypothetical protein